MTPAAPAIPPDVLHATAALFAALAHPGRLQILAVLAGGEPRSVGELVEVVGLEQTALSHQLRLLREARLVRTERDGKRVLYHLADHHVAHIVRDAMAHIQEHTP